MIPIPNQSKVIIMKMYAVCAISALLFLGCNKKCECPPPPNNCMPASVNNGLVLYLPFNGNSQDESGYGNNAINTNATLTTDRNNKPNQAYLFNGTNAFMHVANSASLNPDRITMMAIVKINGFYQGQCHGNNILNKGNSDGGSLTNKYRFRFADDAYKNYNHCNTPVDVAHQAFSADFGGNGFITTPYTGPYVETGKWYTVIYTYDGSTSKFYINGTLSSSKAGTSTYVPSTDDLFIGRLNDALFPYWFNGVMDEVRIYNRALSQEEVTALSGTCYDK